MKDIQESSRFRRDLRRIRLEIEDATHALHDIHEVTTPGRVDLEPHRIGAAHRALRGELEAPGETVEPLSSGDGDPTA